MNMIQFDANDVAQFLLGSEAFKSSPYLDSNGTPTIGIGTTIYPNGKRVTLQDNNITYDYALELLQLHCANIRAVLNKVLAVEQSMNKTTALVSLCYNIGEYGFAGSTVCRAINTNADTKGICVSWLMWDKETIDGVKQFSQGLQNRRYKELSTCNILECQ